MMDKLFGGVWGYVAIAALALGVLAYAFHLGSASATAEGDAKYSRLVAAYTKTALDETTRQATANQDAKAREAVSLAIIAAQSSALAQKQKELSDAADKDPAADNRCLSDDARLRIDSYH